MAGFEAWSAARTPASSGSPLKTPSGSENEPQNTMPHATMATVAMVTAKMNLAVNAIALLRLPVLALEHVIAPAVRKLQGEIQFGSQAYVDNELVGFFQINLDQLFTIHL